MENNSFFIDMFAKLKPKYISFHIEEEKHPHRVVQKIRNFGISPAIALNPHDKTRGDRVFSRRFRYGSTYECKSWI